MKTLIDGVWSDRSIERKALDGSFKRRDAVFRNWITSDGSPGRTGFGGFKAESDRYHLYVSLACPWAHRTVIVRELKGLRNHIGVSVVHPVMLDKGWELKSNFEGATGDPVLGKSAIFEVYLAADASVTSRASVPVLWDKHEQTIVSNESSEIIRMFNSAFNKITKNNVDLYPRELRNDIDTVNSDVYNHINNGVYMAGFATSQKAYSEAVTSLFGQLEELEKRLSSNRYLIGNRITEADWRLFTTLVRFDSVYFGHFKCNVRRLVDYPNLWDYTRALFQYPNVAQTVSFRHIKAHYYGSHPKINPSGIVPDGPQIDFWKSHDRTAKKYL